MSNMSSLERPKNWPDLAAGVVLNNLSDEEQMIWQSLCAEDPTLLEDVRQLQQTFNRVADVVPLHSPSQPFVNHLRQLAQEAVQPESESQERSTVVKTRQERWWVIGMVIGSGAIAFLGSQIYGLHMQVQQLNEQLLDHQSQVEMTNNQLDNVNRQLLQSRDQLTRMEQDLSQTKEQQDAMYQLLQQVTIQDSSATP